MTLAKALGIARGELVAFVGAGGKSVAMFEIARAAREDGTSTLLTSTTDVKRPSDGIVDAIGLAAPDGFAAAAAELRRKGTTVFLAAGSRRDEGSETLVGYPADSILGPPDLSSFDSVLVESDAARGRSLKAPGSGEPSIPATADRVVVSVGLDVLGSPLDGDRVHAPERVRALLGAAAAGGVITVESLFRVLSSREGGRKGVPPRARVSYLLTHAESRARVEDAQSLAARLLGSGASAHVAATSLDEAGRVVVRYAFGT